MHLDNVVQIQAGFNLSSKPSLLTIDGANADEMHTGGQSSNIQYFLMTFYNFPH